MDEPNELILTSGISAEFALGDVLDYIFQYLKIKDLSRASSVCKSWFAVALKEISKRGPEIILIPSIFNKEFEDSDFHVSNLLNSKPFVAILFVGPSLRERRVRNLESEILTAYEKHFPNYLVTVGVDESMMDEKVINSCPGLLGTSNGILGLFLPMFNDVTIKIRLQPLYNDIMPSSFDDSDFLPDINSNLKPVFLIFSSPHSFPSTTQEIFDAIKKRFPQKSYTLWGGAFDDDLKAIRCKKSSDSKDRLGMFFICLTGSSLKSWSTVIDCRTEKHEIDKKLLDFRKNIQFKRITIGLVCGPRYVEDFTKTTYENMYKNSHELMHAIKTCFPNIPFTGIFNYGYHGHFGVDSISEDKNQRMSYEMTMCLLILTYN